MHIIQHELYHIEIIDQLLNYIEELLEQASNFDTLSLEVRRYKF